MVSARKKSTAVKKKRSPAARRGNERLRPATSRKENKPPHSETMIEREERTLEFWRDNDIFQKSEKGLPKKLFGFWHRLFFRQRDFVFYDGPPFATGLPHYGHILQSVAKDAIPRYKTMRGYRVVRRWGWDCHGLPVEVEMEKKIGSKSKKDVEEYGVEKFNQGIRDTIFSYADEWKKIIPRIGRWVDMENDYRTMTTSYMESVWSVFHRLYKNDFVGRGFKPLHLCPRCSTTVSNNEVAEGYSMLKDTAVYVLFPLKDDPSMSMVVWTTTPWTLFGNVALGIAPDEEYAVIEEDKKRYVVHRNMMRMFTNGQCVEIKKGSEFIGKAYTPPFDYLYKGNRGRSTERAWHIYDVPYIDTEVGTGIVHLAPAYGEDDLLIAQKYKLPIRHHVTREGEFVQELGPFAGLRPKEKGNPNTVDKKILAALKEQGALLRSEEIEHRYPVCWRCATPLLNYATDSWFVYTNRYRDHMMRENKDIVWIPEHIRDGRFGNWLEHTRPWAVSRSRYWGTSLPVWQVEKTKKYIIIGSLEEMFEKMRAKNTYSFIRHGHSVSNQNKVFHCIDDEFGGLTEKGRRQASSLAMGMKDTNPTVIFYSPMSRTRETAEYIAEATGAEMVEDPLLMELQVPEMHGKPYADFSNLREKSNAHIDFTKKIGNGESYNDVFFRLLRFLDRVDGEYEGAHIVVVTHRAVVESTHKIRSVDFGRNASSKEYAEAAVDNASVHKFDYKKTTRTETGEIELHRPYIDDIILYDDDGNPARHIGEVFDCWFESGSMPYGSHRYPFEKKSSFDPKRGVGFPADFICEAMDQTRGWFYSMLAIGVGAFNRTPYRRVIATGMIRAADGKKMSKSLRNYSDPMEIVNRYGADALRHYLLGSPVVRGESIDFKDEQVGEIHRKVYTRLHNCFKFYASYAHLPHTWDFNHPLDRYIRARIAETHRAITEGFENYYLDKAVSPIGKFVEDLSDWYIRRSRDRIRHSTGDGASARETLRFVLGEFAKCIAPVAPFYAEYLHRKLLKYHSYVVSPPESVHLCPWPKESAVDEDIIAEMNIVRDIVSIGHSQRAAAGIKVRQPLPSVTIQQEMPNMMREIIAEELNVKRVIVRPIAAEPVVLDLEITPELRVEGFVRSSIRAIQNVRKEAGFSLTETISEIHWHLPEKERKEVRKYDEKIRRELRTEYIRYATRPLEGAHECVVDGVSTQVLLFDRPGKIF